MFADVGMTMQLNKSAKLHGLDNKVTLRLIFSAFGWELRSVFDRPRVWVLLSSAYCVGLFKFSIWLPCWK